MRKATENYRNTRKLTEYKKSTNFKKNKVKEGGQQCSLHFTSYVQDTPMKPSQVPNQLSPPLFRRIIPHSGPELCCKAKPVAQRHPAHSLGSITSRGCIQSGLTGSSVNRTHLKSKDRLSSPKHSVKPVGITSSAPDHILNSSKKPNAKSRDRAGLLQNIVEMMPAVIPVGPIKGGSPSLPQLSQIHSSHPASPVYVRKPKSDSQSYNISGDQVHQSRTTLSNSGTTNESAKRKDCDEGQQHECKTSSQDMVPVEDFNGSSHKKPLESGTGHENGKRLDLQCPNSGDIQTPKPTAVVQQRNSLRAWKRDPQSIPAQAVTTNNIPLQPDTCEQSMCTELSSTSKHKQSHVISAKCHTHMLPSVGAKQVFFGASQYGRLTLHPTSGEDGIKKRNVLPNNTDKSLPLASPQPPQKDNSCSTSNHLSGNPENTTPAIAVKPINKNDQTVERIKLDSNVAKPTSKVTSVSSNGPTVEKSKGPRVRRHVVMPVDTDELFTPDPLTYVVGRKTSKFTTEEAQNKRPTMEKDGLSRAASSSNAPATGSSGHKTENAAPPVVASQISPRSPKRRKLDRDSMTSIKLDNNPVTPSGVQLKKNTVKAEKALLPLSTSASSHVSLDTTASEQTPTSSSQHPQLERQASEKKRVPMSEEDPTDLDLDLSLALDFDVAESSHSSEEEHLISFQEIIACATKPPDTPEKGTFSEPSTPGCQSSKTKDKLLTSTSKSSIYKNSLNNILKEINTNKRAKEIEMEHLTACKKDLLRIAEYEEAEESHAAVISTEEQEFLQRYSLMSNAIKETPPGEMVFNQEKVGQIFDQETLQLRHCMVKPQGTAQKTMLWSSPAQLRLHVAIGLFQEAFDYHSPCPSPVTLFLFKMMSIHTERLVSDGILQALFDIAFTAADERVNNGSHQFRVWVPSLADVTLVLLNMGAAFVTLYPFEHLQPLFTEGDLLEDVYVKRESTLNGEQSAFSEYNYSNVLKYLSFTLGLCPRAYSDDELLLLLTVVSRISLEPQLILMSSLNLYPIHHRIVNNFMEWDRSLPKICAALTDLTDDHHNMCYLVHLLPNSKRGRQLRQHLSLSMISKLIEGNCTYTPTQSNFQLSELRPYLSRMQPSSLLRSMLNSGGTRQNEENTLDQQAYYLCYSLLTLVNEASNLQFFTAQQKEQLLCLSSDLEVHIKCDIRENEKCLYRSKVKDLVARIYTKWQILLQKTRPLRNKLYDYWQPVDTLISCQEKQEDREVSLNDDNDAHPAEASAEEIEKETVAPEEDIKVGEKLVGMEENPATKDRSKTEEATEPASDDLKKAASETQNGTQPSTAHGDASRSFCCMKDGFVSEVCLQQSLL